MFIRGFYKLGSKVAISVKSKHFTNVGKSVKVSYTQVKYMLCVVTSKETKKSVFLSIP